MEGDLLCFALCFVFGKLLLFFFKEFYNYLHFFTPVCESGSFGFLVLWISVFVMFVLVGVSHA
jgi:hypothetical protein